MSKPVFRIVGLLALLLFALTPVRAQSPASDAEVAARELISTMKADDQLRAILPMLLKSMKPAIVQNRPDVERDYDALAPELMAGMEARIGDMSDALVAIYSSNFSAEAFYRTPAGQKFLLKTPLVAQQSLAASQKIGQSTGADAQKRMIEELRSKGHTL